MTSSGRGDVVRSRYGFTLVEALIVVVVLGLIALIAFPRISAAMVKSDLRSARTAVINLTATARAASMQSGRNTWIKFTGNTALVLARPRQTAGAGNADTVGAVQNLSTRYHVTASGMDSIQFDPRGFGVLGAADTVFLSRNGYTESVVIDALGRVTK